MMKSLAFVALVAICLVVEIESHSYVTSPKPRSPQQGGCRIGGPPQYPQYCPGPCEDNYKSSQPIHTYARGQALRVEWPRNNHGSGFIRLSWLPAGVAETHQNFDENAMSYSCHEVGCQADSGAGDDGGDSNGQDGTKNPCFVDTVVPDHLPDGRAVMQWAWYGAGGGYLGDYYSCVNFQISGGPLSNTQAQPVFQGGDASNQGGNVCEYWTTDRLHYCVSEPCGDICDDATAPAGHCGWPPKNGAPFMPLRAQQIPPPPEVPPEVPPAGDDGVDITVSVTVTLPTDPDLVDVTTFTYEIIDVLDLPTRAIDQVLVKLDESTDTSTVISFILKNVKGPDGKRVDVVAASKKLKELADSNDAALQNSLMLNGMKVVDVKENKVNDEGGTSAWVIAVIATGGAIVITAIIAAVVIIVYKRRN